MHNRNSRQASAAQVVLTDGVSPAPVVSMHVYITATPCSELDCTVSNIVETYCYIHCWIRASTELGQTHVRRGINDNLSAADSVETHGYIHAGIPMGMCAGF